jgi:hypothetical protein
MAGGPGVGLALDVSVLQGLDLGGGGGSGRTRPGLTRVGTAPAQEQAHGGEAPDGQIRTSR